MASEPTDHGEKTEERATAFVFGEMDREEAMEFMKAIDASPELQSTVASIRDAVGALQVEFEDESDGVREADRQKIALAIRHSHVEAPPVARLDSEFSPRPWPTGLAVAATLLLACGLTFPALNRVINANTETKGYREKIREIELRNEQLTADIRKAQQELATMRTGLAASTSQEVDTDRSGDETVVLQVKDVQIGDGTQEASMGARDDESESQVAETKRVDDDGSDDPSVNVADSSPLVVTQPALVKQDDSAAVGPQRIADAAPAPIDDRPARIIPSGSELGMPPMLGQRFPVRSDRTKRTNPQPKIGEFAGGDNVMKEIMEGAKATLELMFGAGLTGHYRLDSSNSVGADRDPNLSPLTLEELASRLIDENQIHPISDNPFEPVVQSPLSAFPIDIETAAYDRLRTSLTKHDQLPLPRSVRIEEWINYFDYDYAPPTDGQPFAASLDVAECPWNSEHRLARIGIKGQVIDGDRPPSNLVLLIDVSGSMNQPNKLPVVVGGLQKLIGQLREDDSLGIVVYAGANGVVLDATPGDRKKAMVDALGRLKAGGPTASVKGMELAYNLARDHHIVEGTNRVILCSDGNLNLGVKDNNRLAELVEKNANDGTFLTVLGFGEDKQRDPVIDQIIRDGHGSVASIRNSDDAAKRLVQQIGGDLATIASDVKIRIEFNPMEVQAYRLIGYENHVFSPGDLKDGGDDVGSGAGEFEAGQTVTALYELIPKSSIDDAKDVGDSNPQDDLKYQMRVRYSDEANSGELMTVKLRYKLPSGPDGVEQDGLEMEFAVKDSVQQLDKTDRDFQFAASVAALGMLLRQSPHKGDATYEMVQQFASAGAIGDSSGYREEFKSLVKRAVRLAGN